MGRWIRQFVFFSSITLAACSASESERSPDEVNRLDRALILQWSVSTPVGATPQSTVLSATEQLKIDDRVKVGELGQLETIASFGSTLTELGSAVNLNANVSSKAPVKLRAQANIEGYLHSAGAIDPDDSARVKGGRQGNTPIPAVNTSWKVDFPSSNAGNQTIGRSTTLNLAPGAFGSVDLRSGGTLRLRSGTYFFESFSSEPDGQVAIDVSAGPVFIYVRGTLSFKSPFRAVGGDASRIFIATMSSGVVYIESPLLGTLVAPQGTVELRRPPNNQPHRGAVFGRRIQVFSDVPLLHVPFSWPQICPQGDSDGDGLNDCQEACPTDASKTSPGLCGCGKLETDSDGDGAPDCIDSCDSDPNNIRPGECGCAGQAPQGAACSDRICGGNFTCSADGVCGDPQACSPDGDHCEPRVYGDSVYWVCSGEAPKTQQQAADACARLPGRTLVRIDSRAENELVARLISSPAWTSANDKALDSEWRWGTGDVFYRNGAAVGGRYVNFRNGDPVSGDTAHCGAILPGSGQWVDESCSQALAYVCEGRPANVDPNAGPIAPPLSCTHIDPSATSCPPNPAPTTTACVPASEVMPATRAEFEAQVQACKESCSSDDDPDCATACTGAATVPPPDSRCEPMPGMRCRLTDVAGPCSGPADCSDGRVCLPTYSCDVCARVVDGRCVSDCQEGQSPIAEFRCGRPTLGCAVADDQNERCQEVNLCPEPEALGTSDPFLSPATDLTPAPFDPAVFGTPPAAATVYPADPACDSPPCSAGPSHPWCKYEVQDTAQEKRPDSPPKHARSGDNSLVTFDFDPNLTLRFDAKPLALGETKLDLEASAAFLAAATFRIPGLPPGTLEIIDALASVRAERCRAWSTDSKLEIFGLDYLPVLAPGLEYDTAAAKPEVHDQCEEALKLYEETVNRAKKAMKDAQELLRQYNQLKANGFRFDPALCQEIASDPPFGFPPGDCNTEQVEETINRFIKYYYTRVDELIKEQRALAAKVLTLDETVTLVNQPARTHSVQLFSTNFLIGPVPVNLAMDATAGYGMRGTLNFKLNPGTFLGTGSEEAIANVTANAIPFASAGLALFVGVGFEVGPVGLTAGVQGELTLGRVELPFGAGAGITARVQDDPRPLPPELQAISGGLLRIQPKQYQFGLNYQYGADVRLTEILKGTINARLKVDFLFFSKVWRKTLVSFPGYSSPLIHLFGDTGGFALGTLPWATIQMPLPFVDIQLLPAVPPNPSLPTARFDNSQVEELFYDDLCMCREQLEPCHRDADCCEQLVCRGGSDTEPGLCVPDVD